MGVFNDGIFSDLVMVIVSMFFKTGFEGSPNFSYVRHTTKAAKDLINYSAKHKIILAFGIYEEIENLNKILMLFLKMILKIRSITP